MTRTVQEPLLHPGKKNLNFHMLIGFTATVIAIILSLHFLVPNHHVKSKTHHHQPQPDPDSSPSPSPCLLAYDQEECLSIVSQEKVDSDGPSKFALLQRLLFRHVQDVNYSVAITKDITNENNDESEQGELDDCLELMVLSLDLVTDSLLAVQSYNLEDAQTWLSGVLTNYETCLDGLTVYKNRQIKKGDMMDYLISRAKASLAVLALLKAIREELNPPSAKTRRGEGNSQGKGMNKKAADLVVGKNGTGDYETITEAIAAAPNNSNTRFMIYVKEGVYEENVQVFKKNMTIIGDGMDLTIITGSRNVVDGSTTYRSATLAVVGEGFMLQDICIRNTAGPEKQEAVALRVGADKAAIYRCRIDGYQGTLYAHSLRQFYRECYITGTVDFIFGNAAVVFQNCKLVARKPMKGQKNTLVAQGRTDPNQSTGTSIQFCNITASDDLVPVQSQFPTYIGRSWKPFAKFAVMQSYISDHIDPAGLPEDCSNSDLNTCFFGTFKNTGPGAAFSKSVVMSAI